MIHLASMRTWDLSLFLKIYIKTKQNNNNKAENWTLGMGIYKQCWRNGDKHSLRINSQFTLIAELQANESLLLKQKRA